MAVSAAKISGVEDIVVSNRKMVTRRLTFSSNYATGGEAVTASTFGLRVLNRVIPNGGVAMASDKATGIPIAWDAANLKFVFYEGSSAGTALSEKTNSEAYPTGCFIDVTAIGR